MPMASLNGSYILHKGEIIRQISVGLPYTQAIYEHIKEHDTTPLFYSQMEWFSTKESEMVKKEQRITRVPVAIQPFEKTVAHWQMQNSGPNKILIAGDKEQVKETEQQLLQQYSEQLNIYTSQPGYLEIMDRTASKKTAVEFLIGQFGVRIEETIAIGDNFNDKEMIQFAGMGVAMGNAPDEIKAAADYVTATNNEDGVAKALEYLFA
jgi:Cof subfamily protein (haloacid dehalogenase superfamily)